MNKSIFLLIFVINNAICLSQVGIGTANPNATLDVVGKPTIFSEVDGVLLPRILRSELINKTGYGINQTGTLIYVTDLSGTRNAATINIIEIGLYYFNGTIWEKVSNKNSFGDVKQGIQATDHNGWIKLDGRLLTTLTTSQQAQATTLGFIANLPNATNSYLVQNGTALGSVTGSNTRSIAQNQLPNITLTGNTNTAGAHTHNTRMWFDAIDLGHLAYAANNNDGGSNFNGVTASAGDHAHTLTTSSINGGVSQELFNVAPQSLSVNTFVYLGN